MPQQRVITSPVRLTGSVHPQQIASLVAVDAMARHLTAQGEPPPMWELATLTGDVAVQRAVQRAVAREGDDPEELGRDGFSARARRLEAEAEADLRRLLHDLHVDAGLDRWAAGNEETTRVARVAFVRLYEAGVLTLTESLLDSCPSCETVVDEADADAAEIEVAIVRVNVPLADGTLELDLAEPELLVGAVAVAVPATGAPPDETVYLPLLDAEVPVVAVIDLEAPVIVVPGHDRWSYDLARQQGYPIVEVLDGEGTVRHPGPLEGLGRYAARAAATETLVAEGFVTATFDGREVVRRCYRCGTVLVPLVGRHWILSLKELVEPVIDVIQSGAVAFSPPAEQERLLEAADKAGAWCVSQQLMSGHPIPVATCLDCGQTRVSVEETASCGICMGTLQQHNDVLDARFIAAVTPLAMTGWPNDPEPPGSVVTTLSVGRVGLDTWALPIAALGLRLSGAIPYSRVAVNRMAVGAAEPGARPTTELISLAEAEGTPVTRAALLIGDFDIERARDAVSTLDNPPAGDHSLEECIAPYDKAVSELDAGGALSILLNCAREGLSAGGRASLDALARPLLGGS